MSIQYAKLDAAIMARIADGCAAGVTFNSLVNNYGVHAESARLAAATGRQRFRIVDARVQALRRMGVIAYERARGWTTA